ncbi:MAG: cell surface protein SprA [Bacteroidota bacterium]
MTKLSLLSSIRKLSAHAAHLLGKSPRALWVGILLVALLLGLQDRLRAGGHELDDPYQTSIVRAQVTTDTIPELEDRQGDFITDPSNNPFDLNDPSAVEQSIEFDPETGQYIVTERIGETLFRPPTYVSFDDYMELTRKRDQKLYFDQLGGFQRGDGFKLDDPLAGIDVKSNLIDRLFGGNEISIQPQGSIDLTFGFDYQRVNNPVLTQRQQTNGGFDFDMAIQMNVTGQIGEKLKLNTSYNTQATFNFDNQIKLDYNSDAFGEDDILKKIEAGNVSLPLRGQLIQGAQSLFGLKTELQFGHLRVTALASQQQSENENITIEGGSQVTEFEVRASNYDENRHFFLSHYHRDNFEQALQNLPQINSLINITNLQVWVTNLQTEVENVRDVVALTDLGEAQADVLQNPGRVNPDPQPNLNEICDGLPLPDNRQNDLFPLVNDSTAAIDEVISRLRNRGLESSKDFEIVNAVRLGPRDYTYNPQLGFISLNTPLQAAQVLAVTFEARYKDKILVVGSNPATTSDVAVDSTQTPQIMYAKMLKSTTNSVELKMWDLMMKNVYSIGGYQIGQEDFRFDVQYEDPGEGFKRFLPTSPLANIPLIRVFNLDRLNVQGDPQPDGVFDFVPGVTILPDNGKIIFPVLEPFGDFISERVNLPEDSIYVFDELYDRTPFEAVESAERNRYVLRGQYKSSVSSEISLGAFNIPPESVTVSAGGTMLVEGQDYTVDYSTGRLRILNDAILSSGAPINVSFEDNTVFGLQNKTMLGVRADYDGFGDNINIGATFLNLFERPFTPKVNFGDDPINNRIYGLDFTMNQEAPWLTRALDKLPFYNTTAPSAIDVVAEVAALDPGHSRAINQNRDDRDGIVYVDDFEGSASTIDLRQPTNQWFLASIPQNQTMLFPESVEIGTNSGVNRARINWYRIDPLARQGDDNRDPYTSVVPQVEVFPNLNVQPTQQANIQVFDLSYFPDERGPYNFDTPDGVDGFSAGVTLDSGDPLNPVKLKDPGSRWGGIMRSLTTNDFQTANIEFIEFWMLSPFLDTTDATQATAFGELKEGNLYFHLGNVSEDILQDSRRFFENGLPGPSNPGRPTDETPWGLVPVGQQVTRAFDNNEVTRQLQDVGLDGLTNAQELDFYDDYFDALSMENPQAANLVRDDVSNDDFVFYGDEGVFDGDDRLRERYRRFNNPHGNSGANNGTNLRQAGTNIPDSEDLDRDNTLNISESYLQIRVPIEQDPLNPREILTTGNPFITDRREDVGGSNRIWYRYRIPLRLVDEDYITNVNGFDRSLRSVRFMRMVMKDFQAPTMLRFASLELVRSQWREYTRFEACPESSGMDDIGRSFQIDAVNIEENSGKRPFNYVLPIGIQREQSLGVFNALQNEQSLAMRIDGLCDEKQKAVFKYTEMDFRLYDKLQMFVHAERRNDPDNDLNDDELTMFMRMGSDFESNYYEYEIPLKISRPEAVAGIDEPNLEVYRNEVWRPENNFDFPLEVLKDLKLQRNDESFQKDSLYRQTYIADAAGTEHTISVKGNPNLGFVKVMMIGVRNPKSSMPEDFNVEVWANELRLTGLNEQGGVAALARVDFTLADLGSATIAGNFSGIGFGALDNSVMERSRERITGYDLSATLDMSKFTPERWGLSLPLYVQHSNTTATPEFDPYDTDLKLTEKIAQGETRFERDSIREQAQDITNFTTISLENVRKTNPNSGGGGTPKPWSIENFSASYAYNRTVESDPFISSDVRREHTGSVDYQYSRPTKYIEPFKGIKAKPLRLIKEINLNPLPNSFSFSTIMNRRFAITQYRFAGVQERFNQFYNKRFTWDRNYDLSWDLTRALKINFNAMHYATIDEPDEARIAEDPTITDVREYRRDSIINNVLNFGRPKNYNHNLSVSWNLPIRYLPYMDWVQVRAQYQAGYNWAAAAVNADSLGNIIQNNQRRQITADLNFTKLYDQFPFLKKYNRPSRGRGRGSSRSGSSRNGRNDDKASSSKRKKDKINPGVKTAVRFLMMVRKFRLNYSQTFETVVPGFMPQTRFLGMSSGFEAPGWGFVAGWQPNIRTLSDADRAAANAGNPVANDWLYNNRQWITDNPWHARDVIQNFSESFDARLTVEPFEDFRVEIEANRSFTENYLEGFQVRDKNDPNGLQHFAPIYGGSMQVSYNALNTLFMSDTTEVKELFDQFENSRPIISERLGGNTPHEDEFLAAQGYKEGYGRDQQDVVLAAFVAAYTGQDPRTMDLNLFNTGWRPNWRFTYDGLAKLPGFRDIFASFNLSHGYKSTFIINQYNTSLRYLEGLRDETLAVDGVSQNFYSRLEIPTVVIQENFAPLLSLDMQFINSLSILLDYKQARTLSMGVINRTLSETRSREITTAIGYVMRGVEIGFLTGGKKKKGRRSNREQEEEATGNNRGGRQGQGRSGGRLGVQDLDLQFNFSFRDDLTVAQKLDADIFEPTRGTTAISVSPSAEYQLNDNLSLRLFTDYRLTIPKTSIGFRRVDLAGGVVVRFQLN